MTMGFRLAKAGVESILSAYAATGGYRVLGHNEDSIDAEDLIGTRRLVQVYADSGELSGSFRGPATHDVTIAVDLLTSAKAHVDLSTINNDGATAEELAIAMAASQSASRLANDDMDEFIETIYSVIADNRNINLGVDETVAIVANRWVPSWKKSKPMTRGDMVILHATMDLKCRVNEDFEGLALDTAGTTIKTTFEITTDEDAEPDSGLAASEAGG